MAIALRKSTSGQEIPLGYFLDSTDGDTEETSLSIANTDIKLWKTGATSLVNKNSGGATHMINGVYYTVLDSTDTDTVGGLIVFCHVSGALAVRVECCVYEEAVFDAFFASGAVGDSQGITTLLSRIVGTLASGTHNPQSGDAYARIGVNGASLSAIPWNASWDSEVQSEVDDALVARGLDHLVSASVTGTDIADNSIVAFMVSKSETADWDTFVNVTDSLEAIRDKENDIETDTQDIQNRIPASLVDGRIDSRVGAIVSDSITSDVLDSSAISEIQSGLAKSSDISSLNDISVSEVVSGIENMIVEGAISLRDVLKILLAVSAGKASGGGTSEVTFMDTTDTYERVKASVTTMGDRTSITFDLT